MNTRRITRKGKDGSEFTILEPIDFARFGDNDLYRFSLVHTLDWFIAESTALFIMLNPSTADETHDDPTIRRCKDFTLRAGCGVLSVVNLSPRRATDPDDLIMAGPEEPEVWRANLKNILSEASLANKIVLAYGVNGCIEERDSKIVTMLLNLGYANKFWCLGTTKNGYPRHPLYVPKTQPMVPYNWRVLYGDEATLSPAIRKQRNKATHP